MSLCRKLRHPAARDGKRSRDGKLRHPADAKALKTLMQNIQILLVKPVTSGLGWQVMGLIHLGL